MILFLLRVSCVVVLWVFALRVVSTYSDTDIFNIYIQGNILEVLGRVLLPWM